MLFGKRRFDRRRHFELLGAMFVFLTQSPGDRTFRAEDIVQSCGHPFPNS